MRHRYNFYLNISIYKFNKELQIDFKILKFRSFLHK